MNNRNRNQVKHYDFKLPGWLGLISLLSYTAAVLFSPLAYPGYHWMAQAVSDLSAADAPSLNFWNQLAFLYGPCGLISMMAVTIHVYPGNRKLFKTGVYLFTIMEVLNYISFTMQAELRPMISAAAMVCSLLGLLGMGFGIKNEEFHHLNTPARIAAVLALLGSIGLYVLPSSAIGIADRLLGFVQVGFTAVLGVYLAKGWLDE